VRSGLVRLAAADEALEFRAFDTPAHLTAEQCAVQLSGLEPAAHRLGVDLKLGRYLFKGKETVGNHRHDNTSVAARRAVWHVYGDKSRQE
jgi:hypothetical protein